MKDLLSELKKHLASKEYDLTSDQIDDCVKYAIQFMDEYPGYEGKESPKDYDIDRYTDFVGDMTDFLGNIYSDSTHESSIESLIDEMYRIMYYGEAKPVKF